MSGISYVDSDKGIATRAMADTEGMSNPERAVFWLENLTKAEHRGRHDTLSAARDRAAEQIGAPVSKVKRLWDRWREMKTVCGSVMVPLMLAYEEICEREEAAAGEYRRQRLEMEKARHAADQGMAPEMDGALPSVAGEK